MVPTRLTPNFATVQPPGAQSAIIGYPLDNAVMPQSVYPVDVQWLTGVVDDVFRITLAKSTVAITSYQLHSGTGFNNHWQVDQASWRALAQSSQPTKRPKKGSSLWACTLPAASCPTPPRPLR